MTAIASVVVRDQDFLAAGYVRETSLRYGPLSLGSRIWLCSFETIQGVALPFLPRSYDYVAVTDADAALRFAGRVRQSSRKRSIGVDAGATSFFQIDCQGWAAELDGILVADDWAWTAGDNDKNMIAALVAAYWGPLATSALAHRIYAARWNMPAVSITRGSATLRQALDTIAELANNATWWIDSDKTLHWNDRLTFAPFAMDDLQVTGAVGSFREYHDLEVFEDVTGVGHSVTVSGSGVAAYGTTVYNYPEIARFNRRRSDEDGAPELRILALPDVVDQSLTTVAECEKRGFQELVRVGAKRVVTFRTYEDGLYPGQRVDIVDRVGGTGTVPYPQWRGGRGRVWSSPGNLHLGLGRFVVQSVEPANRSGTDLWEYVVKVGSYEATFEQAVA